MSSDLIFSELTDDELDDSLCVEIAALFQRVFTAAADPEEGVQISGLVKNLFTLAQPDVLWFVARQHSELVGCICFSKIQLSSGRSAYILSPVAVVTDWQRCGIGRQLIGSGLAALAMRQVEIVFTYGDPNYYSRVGFQQLSDEIIQPPLALTQPEGWLIQSLSGTSDLAMMDRAECVEPFANPVYW